MLTIFQRTKRAAHDALLQRGPATTIPVVPHPQRPRQRRGDAGEGQLPPLRGSGVGSNTSLVKSGRRRGFASE